MKREFISIDGLKKVLSPKEMKNITGGSCPMGGRCVGGNSPGSTPCGKDSDCGPDRECVCFGGW